MDNWTIDKKLWKKTELTLYEYIILYLLYNESFQDLQYLIDSEETNINIERLERDNYIREMDDVFIITSKGREVFKDIEVSFEQFWNIYHEIMKRPKQSKKEALTKWKRLSNVDKNKAANKDILKIFRLNTSIGFEPKARTYLEGELFNDEYKIKSNERVRTG